MDFQDSSCHILYVNFGNLSCIVFWDIVWKKQTDKQTNKEQRWKPYPGDYCRRHQLPRVTVVVPMCAIFVVWKLPNISSQLFHNELERWSWQILVNCTYLLISTGRTSAFAPSIVLGISIDFLGMASIGLIQPRGRGLGQ